jgi:hypothetical protein
MSYRSVIYALTVVVLISVAVSTLVSPVHGFDAVAFSLQAGSGVYSRHMDIPCQGFIMAE